jgi:hypothetical protein
MMKTIKKLFFSTALISISYGADPISPTDTCVESPSEIAVEITKEALVGVFDLIDTINAFKDFGISK